VSDREGAIGLSEPCARLFQMLRFAFDGEIGLFEGLLDVVDGRLLIVKSNRNRLGSVVARHIRDALNFLQGRTCPGCRARSDASGYLEFDHTLRGGRRMEHAPGHAEAGRENDGNASLFSHDNSPPFRPATASRLRGSAKVCPEPTLPFVPIRPLPDGPIVSSGAENRVKKIRIFRSMVTAYLMHDPNGVIPDSGIDGRRVLAH
jgi:hypothetical protein